MPLRSYSRFINSPEPFRYFFFRARTVIHPRGLHTAVKIFYPTKSLFNNSLKRL